MRNQVQLITYVDRLSGGGIADLAALLRGPLSGLFGGVHLLPFFDPIDGADAGFDPSDHTLVDPRLGDWEDVAALAADFDVTADLIVNHISRDSPQFRDFLARGSASAFADLFLTSRTRVPARRERLGPARDPSASPGVAFLEVTLANGERRSLWTTFTPQQVDIDVERPQGREYLDAILRDIRRARRAHGAPRRDRLRDQEGRHELLHDPRDLCVHRRALAAQVRALGMEVLVEIHSHYRKQIEIAARVDWVYDFALPPLVLHAFAFRTTRAPLKRWLAIRPRNALTVLDTHDGIGIVDVGAERGDPDPPGLVPPHEIDRLVESIHAHSGGESRLATGAAAPTSISTRSTARSTTRSARDDRNYLLARALQLFVPGIPQIYYVGLLAGSNDSSCCAGPASAGTSTGITTAATSCSARCADLSSRSSAS